MGIKRTTLISRMKKLGIDRAQSLLVPKSHRTQLAATSMSVAVVTFSGWRYRPSTAVEIVIDTCRHQRIARFCLLYSIQQVTEDPAPISLWHAHCFYLASETVTECSRSQSLKRLVSAGWCWRAELVRPWTAEVESAWRSAGEQLQGRKLIIDLANVTVISPDGENHSLHPDEGWREIFLRGRLHEACVEATVPAIPMYVLKIVFT